RRMSESDGNPFDGPGPHLIAAGRLSREKGFDILLDAMPAVLSKLPNARLTILGEGLLREALITHAKNLGLTSTVSFPGFKTNPWRFFRHADLFILASRYEGFPNVLLEALAIGTPIIATNCPGALQEIQSSHNQISLVASEDAAALAEAIIS